MAFGVTETLYQVELGSPKSDPYLILSYADLAYFEELLLDLDKVCSTSGVLFKSCSQLPEPSTPKPGKGYRSRFCASSAQGWGLGLKVWA